MVSIGSGGTDAGFAAAMERLDRVYEMRIKMRSKMLKILAQRSIGGFYKFSVREYKNILIFLFKASQPATNKVICRL
jgi:hypothetical protein